MLSFNDVLLISTKTRGFHQVNYSFETVSIFSDLPQPKGLFFPIHDDNLGKAIENGAIASIWDEKQSLPSYTPNHFPVFFVKDPISRLLQLCEEYIGKSKQKECETMTKFAFYSPLLLNSLPFTYDIAVEEEQTKVIETIKKYLNQNRMG
ncbi:hypothetical protein ACQKP0_06395 [Heyndrickxia sp. NPDC080065]|uniref:hypothetical protein n=1 Tax=Heyndrickxia sp. NPDC080065 TaxID=3390568 RepID=UPI003D06A83F